MGQTSTTSYIEQILLISEVKMFEERKNDVVLYFTRVTDEHICAPFIINENSAVQGRKNSSVKLYDYYRPENEISMVRLYTFFYVNIDFMCILTVSIMYINQKIKLKKPNF